MSALRVTLIAVVLFAAAVMAAVMALRGRTGCVLLALLSVLWILVDQDFEGPVLLTLTSSTGVTASDLVGVAGLVAAGVLWWRRAR